MAEQVQIYAGAVDKGLEGIVACTTAISSIQGSTLLYRGYPIEDLSAAASFEEVAYLLWHGELPKAEELSAFSGELLQAAQLPAELQKVLSHLPHHGVHPMAWIRTAISLLAHFDPSAQDISPEGLKKKAAELTGKMSTLVTFLQSLKTGKPWIPPVAGKSLAWNFLYSLLGGKEPSARHTKIFDTCLVLHADHELNCSAFAARVTASSLSDFYSAITSALGALKGSLHGGANEQVILMLKQIGSIEKATEFVRNAIANKEKVMGIGHRVYKDGDPRAKILRKFSEELTQEVGEPHLYKISVLIDEMMFKEKGLMPNVDFYSATVYNSMGIPAELFTPIFAASRVAGWSAHVMEQLKNNRIYRPRGEWVGPALRHL
jgi:citrate synthase